jgi:FdhD protein
MSVKQADYHALQHKDGSSSRTVDALVTEKPLQIIVNGREFSMTMQTPGDEKYLIRGLLHSEGIKRSHFMIFALEEQERSTRAQIEIDCDKVLLADRTFVATSSCGLCGKKSIENLFDDLAVVSKRPQVKASTILRIYREIDQQETLFGRTGGCHTASAATDDGELLCVFEDIGRHNAVDKVIGWLLEHKQADRAAILTVSGRISFEIIQKCIRINIPILTAISAPSSLAVDMAEQYGITLAAFCRKDRITLYSHHARIAGLE